MSETDQIPTTSGLSRSAVLLKFLGSMNLAITLLVAVSIASIIGTVLQQNQPYTDYVLKFGPFWFEVFKQLDLFDVYSSGWFLAILAFLVISTSVCIYRNAPNMLREMNNFRETVHRKSLGNHSFSREWRLNLAATEATQIAHTLLRHYKFRTREKNEDGHTLISGMKGAGSRLGYVLTHVAIVTICIGGLMDGSALLKISEVMGGVVPETRNMPANEVPERSRLGLDNLSFRGSVTIPEGRKADVAFINYKDGYLVQALPFSVEVKDFRIEHYASGQPKSFESDLVIHDAELAEPLEKTIAVNHPWIYKGYSIYQASFGDGGTRLELLGWPLFGSQRGSKAVTTEVGTDLGLTMNGKAWTLEVSDFRLFNINPAEEEGRKFKNVGPSFQFKLRQETGEAREFINYMLPVERDGAWYFLSGVRNSPAEDFQYLHIPADASGGIGRFMNFLARLEDQQYLKDLAQSSLSAFSSQDELEQVNQARFVDAMVQLVRLFRTDGIQAVVQMVEKTVPEDKRDEVGQIYMRILQQLLGEVYFAVLEEEGVDTQQDMGESLARYFDDATTAIGVLGPYGAPVYFQLKQYDHKQASGLQIAKAPGKMLVYPGCAMLILGVFCMFYLPQRRIWVWIQPEAGQVDILLSGTSVRNRLDFGKEYEKIEAHFGQVLEKHKADQAVV